MDVRYRVLQAAVELGYTKHRHNTEARAQEHLNIGLICRFHASWQNVQPFLEPLFHSVDEVLEQNGEHLLLIPLRREPSVERLHDRVIRNNLKGLISVYFVDRRLFQHLEQSGIPVIVIGDLEHEDLFTAVGVDEFGGSYEAAQHLIALGHRRIAYLDYPRDQQPALVKWRHLGYRTALADAGLDPDGRLHVRVPEDDTALLSEALTTLFSTKPVPTALFSHDDHFLMKAIPTIEGLGLRVPDDVSVIAHGDHIDYTREYIRAVTTMQINHAQLGALAAEMLVDRLRGRLDHTQVIRLKRRLVDRGTCIPPADKPVAKE